MNWPRWSDPRRTCRRPAIRATPGCRRRSRACSTRTRWTAASRCTTARECTTGRWPDINRGLHAESHRLPLRLLLALLLPRLRADRAARGAPRTHGRLPADPARGRVQGVGQRAADRAVRAEGEVLGARLRAFRALRRRALPPPVEVPDRRRGREPRRAVAAAAPARPGESLRARRVPRLLPGRSGHLGRGRRRRRSRSRSESTARR